MNNRCSNMLRSQITENLIQSGRIVSEESKYITLTDKEVKLLSNLADSNKFFKSILESYQKYNQLTLNQYIALIKAEDRITFQNFSVNVPIPQLEKGTEVIIEKGKIIGLDEIPYKSNIIKNFHWVEEITIFNVLNVIKDGIKYSISISDKKLKELNKDLIKNRLISFTAKYKKSFNDTLCLNYIKNIKFFD